MPITTLWVRRISLGYSSVPVPTSGMPRCGSSLMRTPAGPETMWLQPKYIVSHCQTPRQKENKAPPSSTHLPGRLYASAMCRCFCFLILVLFSSPSGLYVEGTRHYFEEMFIIHVPHTDKNNANDQVKKGLLISVLARPIISHYCTEHEIISKCETRIVTQRLSSWIFMFFSLYKSERLH